LGSYPENEPSGRSQEKSADGLEDERNGNQPILIQEPHTEVDAPQLGKLPTMEVNITTVHQNNSANIQLNDVSFQQHDSADEDFKEPAISKRRTKKRMEFKYTIEGVKGQNMTILPPVSARSKPKASKQPFLPQPPVMVMPYSFTGST
jgi:hypothetical protein